MTPITVVASVPSTRSSAGKSSVIHQQWDSPEKDTNTVIHNCYRF